MIQFLLDIITTILAFIIGCLFYRKMNLFYRLLFIQVIIYLLIQVVSFFVTNNNNWLFNLYLPMETFILLASASCYFNSKFVNKLLAILFLFFMSAFLLDVFVWQGFNKFAFHAAMVEGIAVAGLFLFILYFQFQTNEAYNWPLILVCIGHVLYFLCSIPYLSILFYFQDKNPILNRELFVYIILFFAQVRYLFLAISLFLIRNARFSFKHFQIIS